MASRRYIRDSKGRFASKGSGTASGGSAKRTIKMQRLYHGTSPEARKGIETTGFRKTGGMFGPGAYTSPNRNVARTYAHENRTDLNVVRLRVPKGRGTTTDKAIRGKVPGSDNDVINYQQISNQSYQLASAPGAKSTRVRNIAPDSELQNTKRRIPAGANRDYFVLAPDYANKYIVRSPNNKFYPTRSQAKAVNARERFGGDLDDWVRSSVKGAGARRYVDRRRGTKPKRIR